MDLTYAIIPMLGGGEHRRIYREAQLAYIISDERDPTNHPIFSLDTNLGSCLLHLTDAPEPPLKIRKYSTAFHESPSPISLVGKCFLMELHPG
jgi:hypothetical protein